MESGSEDLILNALELYVYVFCHYENTIITVEDR